MKRFGFLVLVFGAVLWGCDKDEEPDRSGSIVLSSERMLASSYYLYGYNYENSEMTRFPWTGDPVPDIINEGFRVIIDGEQRSLPGFNTPDQVKGFALLGSFETQAAAREFYDAYTEVEPGLSFVTISDTVRMNQVWLQLSSAGNYAKLLVTHIREFEGDSDVLNNEVSLDFTYAPGGATTF